MQLILWLLFTGIAASIAWFLQKFFARIIRPRESVFRFIAFLLLTFVSIFLVIVIYGYLLIKGGYL